jgi:hypothetical protein
MLDGVNFDVTQEDGEPQVQAASLSISSHTGYIGKQGI